jgi:(R,R)-butanediol dehydrogenase/meso-butanediol dehydrogenase/diacetyl reductase
LKAAVFQGAGLPHKIESVPDPAPGPHELIVRVERCGICGTDLHATEQHDHAHPALRGFFQRFTPGMILGHEFSGTVVAKGQKVTRFAVGDRLTTMGVAGCGRCEACAAGTPVWCPQKRAVQGGFAEYAVIGEGGAFALPDDVSAVQGALIEPLACSHHAVELAQIHAGARVLVIGAGATGLGAALFARNHGAGRIAITARSKAREGLALDMGADYFIQQGATLQDAVADLLGGPPQYVFECVGAPGLLDQAIMCAAPRGAVIVSGLCYEPDPIASAAAVFKELRLQFSNAYRMADFEAVCARLRAEPGKADKLVTAEIALEEFPSVFEALRGRTAHCKVLVRF